MQVGWLRADGGRVWVCVAVGCTVLRATVTVSLFVVSWVNVINGTPGGWFTHLTLFGVSLLQVSSVL